MITPKKIYYLMISLIFITILLIFSSIYLGRQLLLKSQSSLVEAKLYNYTQEKTEEIFRKNQKLLNENADIAQILSNIVPSEKDQARAVRELNAIAEANNLNVVSVSFPRSDLLTPAKTTETKTDQSSNDKALDQSKSISQAKPIKGMNGVYSIELTTEISSKDGQRIPTDQILSLLQNIENNRRNMRIGSINISSNGETINLKLMIFIKP